MVLSLLLEQRPLKTQLRGGGAGTGKEMELVRSMMSGPAGVILGVC